MSGASKLLVPESIWQSTLNLFEPYAAAGLEAGCLWYGLRQDNNAIAMMIGIPKQENHPRYFDIDADSLAELTESAIALNLVAVAQVHIHPGKDVEHSPWDNQMIVSKRVHSLVLPYYGRRPCNILNIGVHRFESGGWQMLSSFDAEKALQIIPSLTDTR